jgi:broad specificity phosphatase PhoE
MLIGSSRPLSFRLPLPLSQSYLYPLVSLFFRPMSSDLSHSSVSVSVSGLPSRSASFHVLLIRHGESSNNVISDRLHRSWSSYSSAPFSPAEFRRLYDSLRSPDPGLSALGSLQAERLIDHPYLTGLALIPLIEAGRVAFICSPLRRNIETALPMLRWAQQRGVKAKAALAADFCERGGFYHPPEPLPAGCEDQRKRPNRRALGPGRSYFLSQYGSTHDASEIGEGGWWNLDHPEEEREEEYRQRIDRVGRRIVGEARRYWQHWDKSSGQGDNDNDSESEALKDYLVIFSHGDFMDTLIRRFMQVPLEAQVEIHLANTGVAHIQLDRPFSAPAPLSDSGSFLDQLGALKVGIHSVNAKPVFVEATEPEPEQSR